MNVVLSVKYFAALRFWTDVSFCLLMVGFNVPPLSLSSQSELMGPSCHLSVITPGVHHPTYPNRLWQGCYYFTTGLETALCF